MASVATLATCPPAPPARELTEHGRLCALAQRWLMRQHSAGGPGCAFAVTEAWGEGDAERPDAIGWRRSPYDGGAFVVEVKTSRADFLADAAKPHRQDPALGVGRFRYYLCPEGLIQASELPPRWGLLYAGKRNIVRAIAGPAAMTRHACRGQLPRDPSGEPIGFYDAYRQACDAFQFRERNHDLETAMLVALLQRVGDPESTNLTLRTARAHAARLQRDLDLANRRAERLAYELMAARNALEQASAAPAAPNRPPRAAG